MFKLSKHLPTYSGICPFTLRAPANCTVALGSGPKFGYNTMDNGFLLFNNVKVPHISMLARFSSVDPNTNKYVRRGSPSLVYGTLTWVRSTIVMQAGAVLARGVTIATRYCAIRRQFQDRDAPEWEKGENAVLNYTMVQIRLLPLLAATFALHFTGKGMMNLYQENQKRMNEKNAGRDGPSKRGAGPEETQSGSDILADLHATSCGLKALSSSTAAEGLEVCRRACGGHGYSSFRYIQLFTAYDTTNNTAVESALGIRITSQRRHGKGITTCSHSRLLAMSVFPHSSSMSHPPRVHPSLESL